MATDVSKGPLRVSEILGISARIFDAHFSKIAAIGLLVYVPIEIVIASVDPRDPDPIAALKTTLPLRGVFDLLLGVVAMLVVIRLTANAIDGGPTRFGDVWRGVKHRYFSAVATSVAQALVIYGLFILLVIPGVIGLIYTTFFLQVPALREESGFHALKHSKAIIEGRFWRVVGYNILLGGGYHVVFFGADALAKSLSPAAGVPIVAFANVLSLYFTVAFTVLYLNLERTRFD